VMPLVVLAVANSKTRVPWAVGLSWLENSIITPTFWWAILTRIVGQIELIFGV